MNKIGNMQKNNEVTKATVKEQSEHIWKKSDKSHDEPGAQEEIYMCYKSE